MSIPLACDMSPISADQRGAYHALVRGLMASSSSIRNLPNGLAFDWPISQYDSVTRWIDFECRCCPFLTFTLVISNGQGQLMLRVTGPEGAAAFLRAELHLPAA